MEALRARALIINRAFEISSRKSVDAYALLDYETAASIRDEIRVILKSAAEPPALKWPDKATLLAQLNNDDRITKNALPMAENEQESNLLKRKIELIRRAIKILRASK